MPKKITIFLTFLFCLSFLFPSPIFSQTVDQLVTPTPTFDPSNVVVGLSQAESKANEIDGTIPILVELNHVSAVDVIVDVIVAAGDANVGQDYRLVTPRVTIPAGELTTQIEIEVYQDQQKEGIETAGFELMAATGAELNYHQKTHQLKLVDDDGSWWRIESIAGLVLRFLP